MTARDLIKGAVRARKYAMKKGRSYKDAATMRNIIMHCEDLLNSNPSESTVVAFIKKYPRSVRKLIPARSENDKRIQFINSIAA